ncbi:MAG: hypothetical protein RL745_358 [Actinomycetota bacterium]|jgi:PTH1 family peptidyl-tRNA hydrolase
MTADSPWLIVGLGNPGAEYASTRHNIGFLVVDQLAARAQTSLSPQKRSRALVATGRIANEKVVLAQPQSFMNDSGGPTTFLLDFYSVPIEKLIVIHDELDLPWGAVRCKLGGGDNGHNGLRSIRKSTKTGEWFRVRVGIDRPAPPIDPAAYVLKPFASAQRASLDETVARAVDATECLVTEGLAAAQNKFNS